MYFTFKSFHLILRCTIHASIRYSTESVRCSNAQRLVVCVRVNGVCVTPFVCECGRVERRKKTNKTFYSSGFFSSLRFSLVPFVYFLHNWLLFLRCLSYCAPATIFSHFHYYDLLYCLPYYCRNAPNAFCIFFFIAFGHIAIVHDSSFISRRISNNKERETNQMFLASKRLIPSGEALKRRTKKWNMITVHRFCLSLDFSRILGKKYSNKNPIDGEWGRLFVISKHEI